MPMWMLAGSRFLGMFPVTGLCKAAKSFAKIDGVSFSLCSFVTIYSLITTILRIIVKLEFGNLVFGLHVMEESSTTYNAAHLGLTCTFCTGGIYQALSIYRTRRFLKLIKALKAFDDTYPQQSKHKASLSYHFVIQNTMFLFAATVFPVSIVIQAFLGEGFTTEGLKFLEDRYHLMRCNCDGPLKKLGVVFVTILISFLCEAATLFPVIQLTYFTTALENRLSDIYEKLEDNAKSIFDVGAQFDFLLKSFKTSDKKLFAELSLLGKENVIGKPEKKLFWKGLASQYMDYTNVFRKFVRFAGIYFMVLYPMQIMSTVALFYLTIISDMFKEQNYVRYAFYMLNVLGNVRIVSMCNLGHKLERIHAKILKRMCAVDLERISDEHEKYQYQKCLQMVKSIPIALDASGFFVVSRSNIPGIITALVSYIVVLIQFKSAE